MSHANGAQEASRAAQEESSNGYVSRSVGRSRSTLHKLPPPPPPNKRQSNTTPEAPSSANTSASSAASRASVSAPLRPKKSNIKRSVNEILQETSSKRLKSIDLSNQDAVSLPSTLKEMTFLERINASRNRLGDIPIYLRNFTMLTHLDLSNNLLMSVPISFTALQQLQSFNLSRNKLEFFPACILQLSNLKELNLFGNNLVVIPPSINGLSKLEVLNVARNSLLQLPRELAQLRGTLKSLLVYGNPLMPSSLAFLPKLTSVSIEQQEANSLEFEEQQQHRNSDDVSDDDDDTSDDDHSAHDDNSNTGAATSTATSEAQKVPASNPGSNNANTQAPTQQSRNSVLSRVPQIAFSKTDSTTLSEPSTSSSETVTPPSISPLTSPKNRSSVAAALQGLNVDTLMKGLRYSGAQKSAPPKSPTSADAAPNKQPANTYSTPGKTIKPQQLRGYQPPVKQPQGVQQPPQSQPQQQTQQVQQPQKQTDIPQAVHPAIANLTKERRSSSVDREAKMQRRRELVVTEIVESERKYVKFLNILNDEFYRPLMRIGQTNDTTAARIIPEDVVADLFPPDFITIVEFNTQLLNELEQRVEPVQAEKWSANLGDIFSARAPFFKVYVTYIQYYDRTMKVLEECKEKYPAFRHYLEEQINNVRCEGLDFESFIIMPIQRIPRYKLLLEQLVSCTPKRHSDFANITAAIAKVTETAKYVDTKIKESANRARVCEIEKSLKLKDLVAPHRIVIMEGKAMKVMVQKQGLSLDGIIGSRRSSAYVPKIQTQEVHLYLFNDILVYTREKMVLSSVRVHQMKDASVDQYCNAGLMSSSFRLMFKDKTYNLAFKSVEEREKWLLTFQNVIHNAMKG